MVELHRQGMIRRRLQNVFLVSHRQVAKPALADGPCQQKPLKGQVLPGMTEMARCWASTTC